MPTEYDNPGNYLGRKFTLEPEDRLALQTAMRALDLRQIDVARISGISQSWLSNLLSGRLPLRDRDALQRVLTDMGNCIDHSLSTGRLDVDTADRLRSGLNFLQERTDGKPLVEAWGSIPVDAANYIHRGNAEIMIKEILVRDCRHWNFSLAITGQPDSGKSTHLGFLKGIATREGVQIAQVDGHGIRNQESTEEKRVRLFGLLTEEIAYSWELPPHEGITHGGRFERYVRTGLQGLSGKDRTAKRLLVIDDIDRLDDPQVIFELLATLKVMGNSKATSGLNYAIAIGLSPNSLELHKTLRSYSIANQIRMGWFDQNLVSKLVDNFKLSDPEQVTQQLYKWFNGQPFLTHLAVAMLFREGKTLDQVYQEALGGKEHFGWHVRNVRNMLARDPELQALFESAVKNGGVDPKNLDIPYILVEYSIATGLLKQDESGILVPGSIFYADLASHLTTDTE